jgi:hypothetical protein
VTRPDCTCGHTFSAHLPPAGRCTLHCPDGCGEYAAAPPAESYRLSDTELRALAQSAPPAQVLHWQARSMALEVLAGRACKGPGPWVTAQAEEARHTRIRHLQAQLDGIRTTLLAAARHAEDAGEDYVRLSRELITALAADTSPAARSDTWQWLGTDR